MDLFPVTVTRSNWYRGKGSERSALLLLDGQMCCLGHVARACGLTSDQIDGKTSPEKVALNGVVLPDSMRGLITVDLMDTSVCRDMMTVNDSEFRSDKEREARLIDQAKLVGFALTFID